MQAIEINRLVEGDLYEHHQQRLVVRNGSRVAEDVNLGRYRLQQFVRCAITGFEMVITVRVDAQGQPTQDGSVVYSIDHFAREFRPVGTKIILMPEKVVKVVNVASKGPEY